jgi:hypothetical protein
MSLFTRGDLERYKQRYTTKSAAVLESQASIIPIDQEFDVFLSHSYRDAQSLNAADLRAMADIIRSFGFSVYVDWVVDKQLSREYVSHETAAVLRERMRNCKSLLFATTENSSSSKWMPWELGFKDGHNNRAAILPIVDQSRNKFNGQEYLGIYPFVRHLNDSDGRYRLWIFKTSGEYVVFDAWLANGVMPYYH